MKIEIKDKCRKCGNIRTVYGPYEIKTRADLDAMPDDIVWIAKCPNCDILEVQAIYHDDIRMSPWRPARLEQEEADKGLCPLPVGEFIRMHVDDPEARDWARKVLREHVTRMIEDETDRVNDMLQKHLKTSLIRTGMSKKKVSGVMRGMTTHVEPVDRGIPELSQDDITDLIMLQNQVAWLDAYMHTDEYDPADAASIYTRLADDIRYLCGADLTMILPDDVKGWLVMNRAEEEVNNESNLEA